MDDFKIGQLTKEIVAAKLRELPDPCVAAVKLSTDTLRVALKGLEAGSTGDAAVVQDACQGCMTALLLNDQNLPHGAVLLLESVVELAAELNLDQMELMKSALRGISDMKRFAPNAVAEISNALEARFTGAGQAFDALCREVQPSGTPGAAPKG